MTKIYSDLPNQVISALLEQGGYESSPEAESEIKIYKSQLPSNNYRLGDILDLIKAQSGNFIINGIYFDLNAKTATKNQTKLLFTEKEAELITLLRQKPHSREELLGKIWNYAPDATTNTIETHIYRLRQKLSENFGFELIDNSKGNYFLKDNG